MGICACLSICEIYLSVVVLHRSMVNLRRGYIFYMQNLFGVVVLHRSMVN